MSTPFQLDKADGLHIVKVLAWSVASAVITAVISIVATAHVDPNFVFLLPFVNAALVAAQKYVTNEQQ